VAGLTARQREELRQRTQELIRRAAKELGLPLAEVPVRFDLRGSQAGQFRMGDFPLIRYNDALAAVHYAGFLAQTVPHEVAHYVVHLLSGRRRRRPEPHGREWQRVMQMLDAAPERCHRFDLAGIEVRRQQRHRYRCGCREHDLSTTRHNRVRQGTASYRCRTCGETLLPSATAGPA